MSKKNKSNTYFTSSSAPSLTPANQSVETESSQSTYKLVVSKDLNLFTDSVNSLLKQGWLPQGGVDTAAISTPYDVAVVYSQALVKLS